jgi:hypothetical protein
MSPKLAQNRHGAMSGLSPLCAPKRTLVKRYRGLDLGERAQAVSPKYASETPGKARMHTCVEQYVANKETNSNSGMKWIEKGGGYYSVCNERLK